MAVSVGPRDRPWFEEEDGRIFECCSRSRALGLRGGDGVDDLGGVDDFDNVLRVYRNLLSPLGGVEEASWQIISIAGSR
jgi:hypothetical protein